MKKRMALGKKLVFGAIGISLGIIIISMVSVSYIVNRQNVNASNDILRNAFNVVTDDLQVRQTKLLAATQQFSSIDGIGNRVKFALDYKDKVDNISSRNAFKKILQPFYNIVFSSNV